MLFDVRLQDIMSQQFKPNVGGRVCGKRKGVAQFRVEKESALSRYDDSPYMTLQRVGLFLILFIPQPFYPSRATC